MDFCTPVMPFPEDELLCAVCCDIFQDPVLLACCHSFCRSCLRKTWDAFSLRECPLCRKKASKSIPPTNLALKNLCEAVLQSRRKSSTHANDVHNCNIHAERFKLFCLVDKQPICVVCQSSKIHKNHECSPIEEAVLDCKDVLMSTLKILQNKLDNLGKLQTNSADILNHIKAQAWETKQLIKEQFEELHQVLHCVESDTLAALSKEEEEKISGIQTKVTEISSEMLSLRENIVALEEEIKADDMVLLQNFHAMQERSNNLELGPKHIPGALIDVAKHLSNLKYRISDQMQSCIQYNPVTLDPNTAHPCLILSKDLTSLHYSSQLRSCPDNPERFHVSAEVVGMKALGSGSHGWIVETGNNQDWILGVTSVSVPRNAEIAARPDNGFWTLRFLDGELTAMTSLPNPLVTNRKPDQIQVHLDYDKGTLSFFDTADDTLLYMFEDNFTEMLLPYFYTHSDNPLRILPENVCVTVLRR